MASLPIFFIHQGDHFYLRCSLLQARQFNPKSQIFVLGDRRAKRIVDAVNPQAKIEFAFLHHYLPATQDKGYNIGRYYFHISPNCYEYELFCIQRWFILDKFLHQYGIDKAFYQDSDVLLFTEIRPDLRVFSADAAGPVSPCKSMLFIAAYILLYTRCFA